MGRGRYSLYLLYQYKSTNTDATRGQSTARATGAATPASTVQQDMARRLAQGVSVVQRDPDSENRLRGMRSMEDVGSALVLKSEVALSI